MSLLFNINRLSCLVLLLNIELLTVFGLITFCLISSCCFLFLAHRCKVLVPKACFLKNKITGYLEISASAWGLASAFKCKHSLSHNLNQLLELKVSSTELKVSGFFMKV